jgi:hypothetical protein
MIATGSGITLLSIMKHIHFIIIKALTLVYEQSRQKGIIFYRALEDIRIFTCSVFLAFILLARHTDSAINYGRINQKETGALSHIIQYNS